MRSGTLVQVHPRSLGKVSIAYVLMATVR
jgi:hypothetical protein